MKLMKKCRMCGEEKPSTTEYFYRASRCKDGLNTACKPCMRRYQDKYNHGYRKGGQKKTERPAIITGYKDKVLKKHKIGQTVKVYRSPAQGQPIIREKAKIVKFYPHHVLCRIKSYYECFTYWDLDNLTRR